MGYRHSWWDTEAEDNEYDWRRYNINILTEGDGQQGPGEGRPRTRGRRPYTTRGRKEAMTLPKSQQTTELPVGREPTLRVMPSPADVNYTGDIFGGWIMSQVDIAGGILAAVSACVIPFRHRLR